MESQEWKTRRLESGLSGVGWNTGTQALVGRQAGGPTPAREHFF